MYKGSTPTITFKFTTEYDLALIDNLTLTFKQGSFKKKFGKDRIVLDTEAKTATLLLTQEETLRFPEGVVQIQFKFLDVNGKSFYSDIQKIVIAEALDTEVLA